MKARHVSLSVAEAIDAWRIVPRAVLFFYGWFVFQVYIWFKSIPTYVQEKCDPAVLTQVLHTTTLALNNIKELACTVTDVVGGPTMAQSTFVTTIIGLSTAVFGLYSATGRKWEQWNPQQGGGGDNGGDSGSDAGNDDGGSQFQPPLQVAQPPLAATVSSIVAASTSSIKLPTTDVDPMT